MIQFRRLGRPRREKDHEWFRHTQAIRSYFHKIVLMATSEEGVAAAMVEVMVWDLGALAAEMVEGGKVEAKVVVPEAATVEVATVVTMAVAVRWVAFPLGARRSRGNQFLIRTNWRCFRFLHLHRFRYCKVEVGMSQNRAHTKSRTELQIVDSQGVATVEAETMVVRV